MDHRAHAVSRERSGRRAPEGRQQQGPRGGAGFLALLLALELAWLSWFLYVPLRNVENLGVVVRRGILVLKALPEVVPDTSFHDSLLGRAFDELRHIENLPQRLPIVLAAGLVAAAAIGLGDLCLRLLRLDRRISLAERLAVDYGLGAALLGAGTLLVGRMGWLDPSVFRVGLGCLVCAGLVAWGWKIRGRPPEEGRSPGAATAGEPEARTGSGPRQSEPLWWLFALAIAPFLLIMILGSMLPAVDFDVLEYHLQGPKEYFQSGRIAFLPHNVYTNMPFGVEMIHLLGMEVMADWWWGALAGQLLVALFAPATAVLVAATAWRASSRAAWIAALVYLSTPWTYRMAVLGLVEGPLCFYHAALVWVLCALGPDLETTGAGRWGLLGLLAGGAMGCKYPALVSAVIPMAVLAVATSVRYRTFRPLFAYALAWAVVIGPWLGRNAIDTGDPVYPLGYRVFHGRFWDEASELKWRQGHSRRAVTATELGADLVEVAGRSDWQSPLYLALAPLAFLRPGTRRMSLFLWGYVGYIFLTWWLLTHRLDRFWLPLLPPLAVLAGLGADWTKHRGWSILAGVVLSISLLANLTYDTTALAGLNEWTGDLHFLRRDIPRRLNQPLASIDAELPREARILLVGQASVFHVNHPVVYNTVFNHEIIETLARDADASSFHRALRRLGITHVYVDWREIERHRRPGGYGFTDFVTKERFAAWVEAGVLDGPRAAGPEQDLYRVK
jgi:hypothetical protein